MDSVRGLNIAVLHDRVPPEASPDALDNLTQAGEVQAALRTLGHRADLVALSENLADTAAILTGEPVDLVFNLVESVWGSARLLHLVPGLLDGLELPYTGSGPEAMRRTTHKLEAKEALLAAGLPTPDWITPGSGHFESRPEGRFIIKSVLEHASIGLDEDSVMDGDPASIRREIERRRESLGGEGFAEAYVEGREFNLSLLAGADGAGPEVLAPAEIVFQDYGPSKVRVVGYRAKWISDSFEYANTPRRFDFPSQDSGLLDEMAALALSCWKLFDLRGWARVDFRVDGSGRPWILEVNANPCLSSDAGFMTAVRRSGLEPTEAIHRIVGHAGLTQRAWPPSP